MKRLLAVLLVLMLTFACSAFADQAKVMTSFYPMHIFALNVFDGIDEISVNCMTAPETGCLHDYQMIVSDMLKLAESDLFIVCGGGTEPYLEDVMRQFPQLAIADCSEGLTFLEDCGLTHDHEHDHAVNTHAWLNVDNAMRMVDTIAAWGCKQFAEHAEKIKANAEAYKERLSLLNTEISAQLMPLSGKQAITFHEAFAYFAAAYGIEVLASVNHESENGMSPAQIALVIRYVKSAGTPPLFADVTSSTSAAHTVAAETGAKIYAFDPIVSGDKVLTAYEDAMRANAQAVLEAFK